MAEKEKKAKAPAKPRKSTTKAKAAPVAKAAPIELKPLAVSHTEIAQRAREIWAERGYRQGFAEQDWLQAEQELLKKAS